MSNKINEGIELQRRMNEKSLVVLEEYTERSSKCFQHLKDCLTHSVGSKKVLSSTKSKESV